MAPPSSPLDESTRRHLARVLVEEAGWGPEAAEAVVGTAEEAVSVEASIICVVGSTRTINAWMCVFSIDCAARPRHSPFPPTPPQKSRQVCALVQGLFAPAITPRLLPAVDNRVTVLLGSGANVGGRCVARLLFGADEDEDGCDRRPIFPGCV